MKKARQVIASAFVGFAVFMSAALPSLASNRIDGINSKASIGSLDHNRSEEPGEWLLIEKTTYSDYGNGLVEEKELYNYDEKGNCIRRGIYLDGGMISVWETEYEDGRRVKQWDKEADPSEDKIWQYRYDEKGNVTEVILLGTDGVPTGYRLSYTYDEAGRMTGDEERNGSTILSSSTYTYDGDNCVEWSTGKSVTKYYYDGSDIIKREYYYQGELKNVEEYEYADGRVVREVHYDAKGNVTSEAEAGYTVKDGLCIRKITSSVSQSHSFDSESEYEYDENGNLLSEVNYSNGKKYRWSACRYARIGSNESMGIGITRVDVSRSPMQLDGKDICWNMSDGRFYWYENGIKQGTYFDEYGVMGDGTIRGREIFDPGSGQWYWLDAVYDGAKAVGKEVWIPYIYQDENEWDDEKLKAIAAESDEGMGEFVYNTIKNGYGKWVRYDQNGAMLKGWVEIKGELAQLYPDQAGNTYYYDTRTGLMAKGHLTIEGKECYFDETTGALK